MASRLSPVPPAQCRDNMATRHLRKLPKVWLAKRKMAKKTLSEEKLQVQRVADLPLLSPKAEKGHLLHVDGPDSRHRESHLLEELGRKGDMLHSLTVRAVR